MSETPTEAVPEYPRGYAIICEEIANNIAAIHPNIIAVKLRQAAAIARLAADTLEERKRAEHLLAVIHCDGGLYVEQHGWAKACGDAEGIVQSLQERKRALGKNGTRLIQQATDRAEAAEAELEASLEREAKLREALDEHHRWQMMQTLEHGYINSSLYITTVAALAGASTPAPHPPTRLEFKRERYGAEVATLSEAEEQVVEVLRRADGRFDLIIHNRAGETDRWDDLSATLEPKHFAALGTVGASEGDA